MTETPFFKLILSCLFTLLCTACGGGSSSSTPAAKVQSSTPSSQAKSIENSNPSANKSSNTRQIEKTKQKTGLTFRQIQQVMASQTRRFQICYLSEFKKDPNLKGVIKVLFIISGSTGKLLSAKIKETTLQNQNVETCIVKTMKTLRFPSPNSDESISIVYPFNFIPNP